MANGSSWRHCAVITQLSPKAVAVGMHPIALKGTAFAAHTQTPATHREFDMRAQPELDVHVKPNTTGTEINGSEAALVVAEAAVIVIVVVAVVIAESAGC